MLNEQQLKRVSEAVFAIASAPEVEVILSSSDSSLTRFANNTIHQNVSSADDNLTIRTVKAGQVGSASLNRFDEASLRSAVKAAETVMELTRHDPDTVPMQEQTECHMKNRTFFDSTAEFSAMDRAEKVSAAFKMCEKAGCEAAGILSSGSSRIGIANNKGLLQFHESTSAKYSITVEADDVSGWAEITGRNVDELDFTEATERAIQIWKDSHEPAQLEPGKYDVVLPHDAFANFVLFLSFMGFNPRSYHEGTSPLSGKLGDRVFGKNITLTDDFDHPLSLGMPFDFEGTPRKRVDLVKQGVLENIVYDRKHAVKYGEKPTGHGLKQPNAYGAFPGNIIMDAGDSSMSDMVAETDYGVLVTNLHYVNVLKPSDLTLTGMTRDGVFLIENGKVVTPVRNMRFTDSVLRVMNNITHISSEVKPASAFFGGSFVLPAVRAQELEFTSGTEF
ncbi:MAG: TldD/PmbA family protein [Planctomycetota bacterium]|nr:TldD/PmbA family protein [Planctomycetota bacterium]